MRTETGRSRGHGGRALSLGPTSHPFFVFCFTKNLVLLRLESPQAQKDVFERQENKRTISASVKSFITQLACSLRNLPLPRGSNHQLCPGPATPACRTCTFHSYSELSVSAPRSSSPFLLPLAHELVHPLPALRSAAPNLLPQRETVTWGISSWARTTIGWSLRLNCSQICPFSVIPHVRWPSPLPGDSYRRLPTCSQKLG